MPTEAQLTKAGYPRACRACNGYGWHDHPKGVIEVRMSRTSAVMGLKSKACPVCGANPCPNGK